jgi:hypothetical protein
MPTKKGSSKASKAKKASNKRRKAPKRGVSGRAGATRRTSTGRVTATGRSVGTSKKAADTAPGSNPGSQVAPRPLSRGPEGLPDRKATETGRVATDGSERIRDL